MSSNHSRIPIIAAGVVTPFTVLEALNNTINNLLPKRKTEIGPFHLTHDGRVDSTYVKQFVEEFPILRKREKFLDQSSILTLKSAYDALQGVTFDGDSTSLFSATGPARGELPLFLEWSERQKENPTEEFPLLKASEVIQLLPNILISNLSINLQLRGENSIFSGLTSAGGSAIDAALDCLRDNKCAHSLLTAVSTPLNYFNLDSFQKIPQLHNRFNTFFETGITMVLAAPQQSTKQPILGSIEEITFFSITDFPLTDNQLIDQYHARGNPKKHLQIRVIPKNLQGALTAAIPLAIISCLQQMQLPQSPQELVLLVPCENQCAAAIHLFGSLF